MTRFFIANRGSADATTFKIEVRIFSEIYRVFRFSPQTYKICLALFGRGPRVSSLRQTGTQTALPLIEKPLVHRAEYFTIFMSAVRVRQPAHAYFMPLTAENIVLSNKIFKGQKARRR